MAGTNGSTDKSLSALGAPHWFCEYDKRSQARSDSIENRVTLLEAAVVKGASKAGAKSGQRWGAFLGALLATAISTGFASCGDSAKDKTEQSP